MLPASAIVTKLRKVPRSRLRRRFVVINYCESTNQYYSFYLYS
jgi:hypothetical protein